MIINSHQSKWYIILLFFTIAFLLTTYKITVDFDYKWNWQLIPQYFLNHQNIKVESPIDGKIQLDKKNNKLIIQNDNQQIQTYSFKNADLLVQDGEEVYEGDTLFQTYEWRIGILLKGLWVTVKISLCASILALILGIMTGLARTSRNPIFKWPSTFYVEVIRGTPLLVQLFIIYFVIGTVIGIDDRFVCGFIALGVFAGAYTGEIIRSGIDSIHFGQMEAARSLGMTKTQAMIHVILPQVFKITLPALAGTVISLIKDSSLVSVMALTDLTKAGREIVSSSFMVFETWITVACLYFILTFVLSLLVKKLEFKMSAGYRT
ncbi:MAG: ABC transporter permease subunit [Halobacteriovoraceae bacterium]|nr:ABC transporter permease subunit [Halobacteriovoraceae bacterium]